MIYYDKLSISVQQYGRRAESTYPGEISAHINTRTRVANGRRLVAASTHLFIAIDKSSRRQVANETNETNRKLLYFGTCSIASRYSPNV